MTKKNIYIIPLFFLSILTTGYSQVRNANIKDSVLAKFLKFIPESEHKEFIAEYKTMTNEQKKSTLELFDLMSSMPRSSKKELIQNIDSNYREILNLKEFYSKLIPSNYSIYIEFKPPEKLLQQGESIDLTVTKKNSSGAFNVTFQDWNIQLNSAKLDSALKFTTLTKTNLMQIKEALRNANCISISNGDKTNIGFSRSGMGKYSYLLFKANLTDKEKKAYTNGCDNIFYRDNIVLVYGGGAIGAQCFPD